MRKAGRIIEAAWRANPHPDLAEGYAHLRPGDSARERLVRIQSLAEKSPGNVEAALAVGRAALDAQEFAIARQALAPLAVVPTQRVAALMAELEEKEHNDEGRAREWMARALHGRRDPAWTADGFVSAALDADFAGHRPARRVRVEGPAVRSRRRPPDDRGRRDRDATVSLPATVERRPAHVAARPLAGREVGAGAAAQQRPSRWSSRRRPRHCARAPRGRNRRCPVRRPSFRWCMRRTIPAPTSKPRPSRCRKAKPSPTSGAVCGSISRPPSSPDLAAGRAPCQAGPQPISGRIRYPGPRGPQ